MPWFDGGSLTFSENFKMKSILETTIKRQKFVNNILMVTYPIEKIHLIVNNWCNFEANIFNNYKNITKYLCLHDRDDDVDNASYAKGTTISKDCINCYTCILIINTTKACHNYIGMVSFGNMSRVMAALTMLDAFNSFPNDKVSFQPRLADSNLDVAQMIKLVFDKEENIVGKLENAAPLPMMLLKGFFLRVDKTLDYVVKFKVPIAPN